MSGELLFRIIDIEQYQRVQPLLDQLRGPTPSDAGTTAAVEAALAMPRPEPKPNIGSTRMTSYGRQEAERVARGCSRSPRLFLAPRELDAATEFLIKTLAFIDCGVWSSLSPGASWVVLDTLLPPIVEEPWFKPIHYAEPQVCSLLPYPRGETSTVLITREATDALRAGLSISLLKGFAESERNALVAIADRVLAQPSWGLAFESLL